MIPYYNNYFWFYPFLPNNCDLPPTIYSILDSIVNFGKPENEKIKAPQLSENGRSTIFNFDYPLSSKVDKEKFECMILNHFLQRRIGFETVTAFRIQLDVKLNEIMPFYNKMFDALENWDLFDGETMERAGKDDRKTENTNNAKNNLTNHSLTTTNDTSDRRNSELPQSRLEDVRNGSYVTNYSYDTNNNNSEDTSYSEGTSEATNNGTDVNEYNETIKRTSADKIAIIKEMQENVKTIYSMIFKDLECLFYQLV